MVLSLDPKWLQGSRGAHSEPAVPRRAYFLTFEAARCDVNVATLLALISVTICTQRFNKGVTFESSVPILIDRTHVRTHHMLPPPLQGSSHTLPQSLPSPALLLLSSDNICTPKFIKSMTLFLSARLE